MPSGVSKFEREPEIPRQLIEKFAQRRFAVFWRKGGRQLDRVSPGALARAPQSPEETNSILLCNRAVAGCA